MHGALTSLFFDHRFLSTRSYLRYPWPHVPNFQQRQYLIFTCFSNFGHYGHLLIVLDDILLGIMAYLLGAVILPQFFYNNTKSGIGQDIGHFRGGPSSTGVGFLPNSENIS